MKSRVIKYVFLTVLLIGTYIQVVPGASADGEFVRVEETDPRISYRDYLLGRESGNYSGGYMKSCRRSTDPCTMVFNFHGTAIELGLASVSWDGYADVYIDNVKHNTEPIFIPAGSVVPYTITGLIDRWVDPFNGEEYIEYHRVMVVKSEDYPYPNEIGIDYIEYQNYTPVTDNATGVTKQLSPVSGMLTATDLNQDVIHFSKESDPANGTAVVESNGSWTYTPSVGFAGVDSFIVRGSDGTASSTATVTIDVQNLEPTIQSYIEQEMTQGSALSGTAVGGSDPGGDVLTYATGMNPLNGTISVQADGSWTYTPNTGYYGADRFSLIATDPYGSTTEQVTAIIIARGAATQITSADIEDGTITLADLSPTVKERLGNAPLLTVVRGQAFDEIVAGHDSLTDGVGSNGVLVSNVSTNDGYIRLQGTLSTTGIQTIEIDGNRFVFEVVEPISSSNVTVTFDE